MSRTAGADAGTRQVAICGSCVSRDTVEFAQTLRMAPAGYIARQSLASMGSDASVHYPLDARLPSMFQTRSVRGDFAGDLLARFVPAAAAADLVLIDIVDERFGVHVMRDSTVVTRSVDALGVPEIARVLEGGRHVPFGSAEHYAMWSVGAVDLVAALDRIGAVERAAVLAVPWAEQTIDGRASPSSMGLSAHEANRKSLPYYARLRDLGLTLIEVGADIVRADPSHRWGLAPFHFAPPVYEAILQRM